jgi:hypothetical protein
MSLSPLTQVSTHAAHSELDFNSSDTGLVNSFRWAKMEAMSNVFDGDQSALGMKPRFPGVKPSACVTLRIRPTVHRHSALRDITTTCFAGSRKISLLRKTGAATGRSTD